MNVWSLFLDISGQFQCDHTNYSALRSRFLAEWYLFLLKSPCKIFSEINNSHKTVTKWLTLTYFLLGDSTFNFKSTGRYQPKSIRPYYKHYVNMKPARPWMLVHLKIIWQFHAHPVHQKVSRFFGPRYIGDDFYLGH